MKPQHPQPALRAMLRATPVGRQPAFTLVEMVVAIGIMVLMITMAGAVFSLTLRSTGQAKALTDISHRLRIFEQTLTEDLRNVRRGASKMVIKAHAVNAYWTEAQRDLDDDGDPQTGALPGGGDPERQHWDVGADQTRAELPRADVLMFFTACPGASYIDPSVRSNLQLVVYGHAELGELSPEETGDDWHVNPLAFDGHYMPQDPDDPASPPFPVPASGSALSPAWHLARRSVVVTNLDPGAALTELGDARLLTGEADIILSVPAPGNFDYQSQVMQGFANPWDDDDDNTGTLWYRRSQLDLTPPARLANRLGPYFLPNCASFKVEWALTHPLLRDHPDVIWVDSLNQATLILAEDRLEEIWNRYDPDEEDVEIDALQLLRASFDERFVADFNPDVGLRFHAEDPGSHTVVSPPGTPDPFFPVALRITVDLYDDTDRLERPIRHVMVIPVGR